MAIRIGIVPGEWGVLFANDPREIAWNVFLDESAEAGYEWIEVGPYGYLPTNVDVLRSELAARRLNVIAATVMNGHLENREDWATIEEETLKVGELGASLGAKHLVLIDDSYTVRDTGEPKMDRRLRGERWKRLIESVHRVADLARERLGLAIAFHPHGETHVETEQQVEALLQDTDADRVSLCLDTGHHAFCGGNPLEFVRKHHGRISYFHLKNPDRAMLEKVRAENIPLERACRMGVFTELSLGTIDYREISKVLNDTGFDGWVMVEQETTREPVPGAIVPAAKRALQYLREIGMG